MRRFYVTTTIPYVNASPHLGHALEFVQADVLARARRRAGDRVRFLSGTDDNALKNVLAAEAAGVPVEAYVNARADEFEALTAALDLSLDDSIRTSSDPRHRGGVERLWAATRASGDLYERDYEGRYCVGCEQFYKPGELRAGRCPEHGTEPEVIAERNWFFRLGRYADPLLDAIESGALRIEPSARRNEVVAFIRSGLDDLSVSRSARRARGWGIPVPGDPTQVIYVWYDALGNYISSLGYGASDADYRSWWVDADERVHVIGKGVLRFHAVYWPAFLLSAGEPLPTAVYVHDYLTVDGAKISKSTGTAADPLDVVRAFGVDALRWWFATDVPRAGDTDFTEQRLVERANQDLANGFGNLLGRVLALVERDGSGAPAAPDPLLDLAAEADAAVQAALDRFDIRGAAGVVEGLIGAANAAVQQRRPWELARTDRAAYEHTIGCLSVVIRGIAELLEVFTPGLAGRAAALLDGRSDGVLYERLQVPELTRPAV